MHVDKKKAQIAVLTVLGCALIGSAAFQFFPEQKSVSERPVKKVAPKTASAAMWRKGKPLSISGWRVPSRSRP